MLQVSNLAKSFGSQVLFDDLSFSMERKERLGLVGRNGSGKTTLLRILMGEESADAGTILYPKHYKLGALKQHITFSKATLIEECCQNLDLHEQYIAEKILFGLGFTKDDLTKPPQVFSGGFQIRIRLTKVLANHPDLLLLDEPTNYLDIVSIRWLKRFLKAFPGEFILITHDRQFMDDVTTHIMGLHRKRLRKVKGDCAKYQEQILTEEDSHERMRANQQRDIQQMRGYIDRFRSSARRSSQAQSRLKRLDRMEEKVALKRESQLHFRFNFEDCPAKRLCLVHNLTFDYDPNKKPPMIEKLTFNLSKGDRIGMVGPNGKGKSTVLNLLAGELSPTGGSIKSHLDLRIGHFGQTNINRLNLDRSIEEEISASNPQLPRQEVLNICGTMMFSRTLAQKKIAVLSGGERSRVLLGKLLAHPANVLLLDEPTNHLDQESIEALLTGIDAFPGAVIIVTHSELILNHLAKKLIVFHKNRVEWVDGDYNYFLDKYGWEEEGNPQPCSSDPNAPPPRLSKKALRAKRGEIMTQRASHLKPLKTKMDEFEKRITALEEEHKIKNHAIIAAAQAKDSALIQTLSIDLAKIEKKVTELFDRLEMVTTEHDAAAKEYDSKLQEF